MLTPSVCVAFAAFTLAQAEKTAFIVTVGNFRPTARESRMAVTTIQLGKQKCLLWSIGEEQPSSENDSLTRISGHHPLPGGERAKWACAAETGRKFTEVTVGQKTYDLADGRLFLLSGTAGDVKVLQLDKDPSRLGDLELMGMAKEDPEVREFFAK